MAVEPNILMQQSHAIADLVRENTQLRADLAEAERLLDSLLCLAPFSNNGVYMDAASAAKRFLNRKETPNG